MRTVGSDSVSGGKQSLVSLLLKKEEVSVDGKRPQLFPLDDDSVTYFLFDFLLSEERRSRARAPHIHKSLLFSIFKSTANRNTRGSVG